MIDDESFQDEQRLHAGVNIENRLSHRVSHYVFLQSNDLFVLTSRSVIFTYRAAHQAQFRTKRHI